MIDFPSLGFIPVSGASKPYLFNLITLIIIAKMNLEVKLRVGYNGTSTKDFNSLRDVRGG